MCWLYVFLLRGRILIMTMIISFLVRNVFMANIAKRLCRVGLVLNI